MQYDDILRQLNNYVPHTPTEAQHHSNTVAFVKRQPQCWQRSTVEGHITASAWIIDPAHDHALLVHHRKLDRWFQPGGHIEDDADLFGAARREAQEECGLPTLTPVVPAIFDIDVHAIPANSKEQQHLHYDIRFAFYADPHAPLVVSAESKAVRWFPLETLLADDTEISIRRMAAKTRGHSS